MRKRNAFTLIELMVVITIIAVLVGLLLPATMAVRQSAQSVICQSQLRGLTLAWQSYCKNNDDFSLTYGIFTNGSYDIAWAELLAPYMQNQSWTRLCPRTDEQRPRPGTGPGTNRLAYIADTTTHPFAGSYTFNLALDSTGTQNWGISPADLFVHGSNLPQGGVLVPVFCDGVWRETTPDNSPNPPPDFNNGGWGSSFAGVQRVCIDRHNKAINVGFGDCHVENVRLPQLWMLQWSKTTTPRNVTSLFPAGYQ